MAEVGLQQIGTYSVTGLLRATSTSDIYTGKQRKKEILIKRLTVPLPAPEDKKAFLTRAKQLKKLQNRTIVNILDANFDGEYGYLVMDTIPGIAMSQRIKAGEQLAADEAKRYLSPLADALHYAHLNNIVHGNLQPGNLFVDERNNVLLTEFSLTPVDALFELDDQREAIPYMAPEQLEGRTNAATDQYSLAVIIYELLCGRRPYQETGREPLLQKQLQEEPPPVRSFNSGISASVEQVLLQALSRNPEERFPHTQAFAKAYLNALLGLPIKSLETPHVVPATPILNGNGNSKIGQRIPPVPSPRPVRKEEQPVGLPGQDQQDTKEEVSAQTQDGEGVQSKVIERTRSREKRPLDSKNTQTGDSEREIRQKDEVRPLPQANEEMQGQIEEEEQLEVVPAISTSRLQRIVTDDLCQGGVLSDSLPGYEERTAQVEMATIVSQAINQRVPAIIEAATGTGKSLAYLVPVVRSGQVAIVSTANKALQEQLYYKDIPFVQKHIKYFEAALVKGVNNYICLDRVDKERIGMQAFAKNRDFQRLYDFMNEPETGIGFTGDFETLDFHLPSDIRSRIATDSDQCAWKKCDFFEDCYVHQMRERAASAQVIVVNHTLLLLDAAMGGFLLPERDVIILDEAHHLEEEATRSFTITIHPHQIQTLLAQRMLKDHSNLSLQDKAMQAAQLLWFRVEQIAEAAIKGRVNLEAPVEEGLKLATALADVVVSMEAQRPKDLSDKDDQLYEKLVKRAQNLAEGIRTVFAVADASKFVYYVERVEGSVSRGFVFQVSAAPLDVTAWLKERLFDKTNVISTSATLATIGPNPAKPQEKGPNFNYFRRRIGLDPLERSDVLERILPLTFDYESNALLYLPRDLPAPAYGPGSDDYMISIAREMYRLVRLSRGRAFLLFSSRRMLDRAYELMSPHLPYPLLKQGDMTRLELTKRFREEEGAVLFGLKSFWEGVDIAGEALSLVVIDKLPFDPPDDPVHEARVAMMKAAGENWFGTYVLPQAVLRLKQGIGRLLRTREDRGVMAILDTRLHTKGYGKMVIDALPPARRTSNIRDVERFFV
jgi:Rad3-related DNA helicase/serine/threonine protein kinase